MPGSTGSNARSTRPTMRAGEFQPSITMHPERHLLGRGSMDVEFSRVATAISIIFSPHRASWSFRRFEFTHFSHGFLGAVACPLLHACKSRKIERERLQKRRH